MNREIYLRDGTGDFNRQRGPRNPHQIVTLYVPDFNNDTTQYLTTGIIVP